MSSAKNFEVAMPGTGQKMRLKSAEEVRMFNDSKDKYIEDYQLTKLNDLVLLGALLFQQIQMARAQAGLSGMREKLDNQGVGTGEWIEMEPDEIAAAAAMLQKATDQIKSLEKSLGIDKVTRESGGAYNLADYLRTLKAAAHERGIHISKRVLRMEKFFNDLAWKIRALQTWDIEDRSHHNLTPETVVEWAAEEIKEIKEADKQFAQDKGKLFVGKL
jgi:hypothetical protein